MRSERHWPSRPDYILKTPIKALSLSLWFSSSSSSLCPQPLLILCQNTQAKIYHGVQLHIIFMYIYWNKNYLFSRFGDRFLDRQSAVSVDLEETAVISLRARQRRHFVLDVSVQSTTQAVCLQTKRNCTIIQYKNIIYFLLKAYKILSVHFPTSGVKQWLLIMENREQCH